jgi:hypothetical protein
MSQVLTVLDVNALPKQVDTHIGYSLQNRFQAALEHARRLTNMYEKGRIEIALAWETVEELEKAQRHSHTPRLTNFELYCLAHPDAPECRIYDL